jgi:hypothetical protein
MQRILTKSRIVYSMRKLTVSIPDELDTRLRAYTKKEFGNIKGGLSFVVLKALEAYLKKS